MIRKEHHEAGEITYRDAVQDHIEPIARLHAESWRRTYRGMFPDEYLDGDLVGDRQRVWRQRLTEPKEGQVVVLGAADERLAGFLCGYVREDPVWGSLVDNLHVDAPFRSRGIGAELMRRAGRAFVAADPDDRGVYLWVLEANHPARRFYERLGAENAETLMAEVHPGHRLMSCRYVWPRASGLAAI